MNPSGMLLKKRKVKTPFGPVSFDPLSIIMNQFRTQLRLGQRAKKQVQKQSSLQAELARYQNYKGPVANAKAGKTTIAAGGNFSMSKTKLRSSKKRVRKDIYDRLNTKSMTMQYVSCNEFEEPAGKVSFVHNSATGDAPIHLIDITGIYNNGINPQGLRAYNRNTSDPFQSAPPGANPNWFRVQSQNPQPGSGTGDIDRAILKSMSAKILLRGCSSRSMRYRIILFKARDEDMQMYDRNFTERKESDVTHFWDRQLAQWTQNPCRQLVNGSAYKRPLNIIWQKDYIIQEQSADYDKREKRMVKITRDFNEIKDYNIGTDIAASYNPLGERPNDVAVDEGYTGTPYCRPRQRIYLGIIAQETLDHSSTNNEIGELDRASYDIDIVTRWDIASA